MSLYKFSLGTASVANGSKTITFSGVSLGNADSPAFREGDTFCIPVQSLVPRQMLESVDYVTKSAQLYEPWPGITVVNGAYRVDYLSDTSRSTAQSRRLIEIMGTLGKTGIAINSFGDFADRASYDTKLSGHTFLSFDGDGDTIEDSVCFVKNSSTPGDWSEAIRFRVTTAEVLAALGVTKITISEDAPDPEVGVEGEIHFQVS